MLAFHDYLGEEKPGVHICLLKTAERVMGWLELNEL